MRTFITRLIQFIARFFAGVNNIITQYGEPANRVVAFVSMIVNNPKLDIAVAMTKTRIDDKLLAICREIVNLWNINTKGAEDDLANVVKLAEYIRKRPKHEQAAILAKLSSQMLQLLYKHEKILTDVEADTLSQISYMRNKEELDRLRQVEA